MKQSFISIDAVRGMRPYAVLLAGGALFGAVLLSLAVLHQSGSPLQLVRADHFLVQGEVDRALEIYRTEVEQGWTSTQRRLAHERVASVLSLEKNKEKEAAEAWEALAKNTVVGDENRSRYWANAATHYVISGTELERAAMAFTRAAKNSRSEEDAAQLALLAGHQWLRSGSSDAAERAWVRVSHQYPEYRSEALVSLGKLNLGLGQTEEALSWFEDSVDAAKTEAQRLNGKMGVQISLERLGNLDEAIAELNETGLSEALRDVRTQKILERGEKLQME